MRVVHVDVGVVEVTMSKLWSSNCNSILLSWVTVKERKLIYHSTDIW